MTPGEQLRRWRTARKLSIDAACKPARLNRSTWWQAEHGTRCSAETAKRLLKATGIVFEPDGPLDQSQPAVGKVGRALRAWRMARGLSKAQAGAHCGCSATPFRVIEAGGHVGPATAKLILLQTGIAVPAADNRHNNTWATANFAAKSTRICSACCGLPHRRPQDHPCRCGGVWAPDVVEVASGLRSAADWMGDRGGEVDE